MRACLTLAVALVLAACSKAPEADGAAAAAETAADATAAGVTPAAVPAAVSPRNFALTCVAPFTPEATAATLAAAFGKENVIPETIDGPEGEKLNVTAIYPTDPPKRIEVYFKDEEARTGLASVTVKSNASVWSGPGGVKMGDGIEAVEAANGGVFQISGFGWDLWRLCQRLEGREAEGDRSGLPYSAEVQASSGQSGQVDHRRARPGFGPTGDAGGEADSHGIRY